MMGGKMNVIKPNTGSGVCSTEHTLIITFTDIAEAYSLIAETTRYITQAVHSVNRQNPQNERLAIAFPAVGEGVCLGNTIQVFGSEALLLDLVSTDSFKFALKRRLIHKECSNILKTNTLTDVTPTCFYRVQEKYKTPAAHARIVRRLEKRAKAQGRKFVDRTKLNTTKNVDTHHVRVQNNVMVHFCMKQVEKVAETIEVGTYGLAYSNSECGLPVVRV